MSSPDITSLEQAAAQEVLETRYLSIGPKIVAFEEALAAYVDQAHGIGVNSGTSGLHLCMIAAGIGDGDLVLTTPFSFVASANCILYERGVPIFVDVDPRTGNIDPDLVVEAGHALLQGGEKARKWLPPSMRNGRLDPQQYGRIKCLLPVHAFGQPADMDPILEFAHSNELTVIEDACEALGAGYRGRPAGTMSDAAVFAFYPNKQITTGEGGMIVTANEKWRDLFRSLRNQGRDVFDAWLNHSRLGYNYRLDELSAALGLAQIERVDELLKKRDQVACWYNERLQNLELVEIPTVVSTTTRMSWFVYVVRILSPAQRNQVMTKLAEEEIPSRPYFTPIHLQSLYRERFNYERGDFPVTEYLGDVSLALPFSSVMTEAQVDRVCSALASIVRQAPGK
jgi:dTDP-4-amino-4,6-dideoxygalactose transaminase